MSIVNSEVREVFENAQKANSKRGYIIDCPVCLGVGKRQDAKTLKIRDCVCCLGVGKIVNKDFKHQQA